MNELKSLLNKVQTIRMWTQHGLFAPHKPLLMLLALGEFSRGRTQNPYCETKVKLTDLLKDFGPSRKTHHPEQPFLRLENDGLWCVNSDKPLKAKSGKISQGELLDKNAIGCFPDEVLHVLESDPRNIGIVAKRILDSNFPETLHRDILDAVGLETDALYPDLIDAVGLEAERETVTRPKRDPKFRHNVLMAYGWQCCVCGYDLRLGNQIAGLEAAHIKWHTLGGPDEVTNGLALCVLHHKAFDLGAFSVWEDKRTIAFSQHLAGTSQLEWLTAFHGKSLRNPQNNDYLPKPQHLKWHRDNIFKRPERKLE